MAHIKHTVTTKACPQCGHIFEQDDDFWRIFLLPVFPIYLSYMLAYWILSECILGVYVPKVGNPYIICPKCKTKINTGKKSYEQLNEIEKSLYDNRGLFRAAYFFGGTMIIALLLIFLKLSKNPIDRACGNASIAVAAVCFLIVIFISVYWWRKDLRNVKTTNTVQAHSTEMPRYTKPDIPSERTNTIRCAPSGGKEDLSSLINLCNINLDFTAEDIGKIEQDINTYRKENLPELFKRCKAENGSNSECIKEVAKTLIYMYSRNDKLLIAKKDNTIPVVNTAFGRYLQIYTEEKYFNHSVGNGYVEKPTKDIFELFYLMNECNQCEGIVFNYGTDSMLLLPKITIDNIGFDSVFDVTWKI